MDLILGWELAKNWLKIKDFRQNRRLKINYVNFESVVMYYNDEIYISKHVSTNFHSLTLLSGPVDVHFGLGIIQKLAENQGFLSKWAAQG